MSALAEKPERIKRVFNNIEEYPENGMFQLNVYAQGKPAIITIDDQLYGRDWYGKFYPSFT